MKTCIDNLEVGDNDIAVDRVIKARNKKPKWRVGRSLGRTLYIDDRCIGMVDTPEIAALIVASMNK